MTTPLHQLIAMSRTLGDPRKDLVILGEGNTSVRADGESFWVKALGYLSAGPAGRSRCKKNSATKRAPTT